MSLIGRAALEGGNQQYSDHSMLATHLDSGGTYITDSSDESLVEVGDVAECMERGRSGGGG